MARVISSIPLALTLAMALAAGSTAQPMDPPAGASETTPAAAADALKDVLTVGKRAPELKVTGWLKGEPVKEFKEGQVYVVEAWATWCPPCRQSIPHLTELQKRFGDKVQIIGVDVMEQDWEGVPAFVKEMGDQMEYRVAQDRSADFDKSWMAAAKQSGIPSAFVVNQKGVIAWIGHPMELDGVLPKVVDGSWDMAKATEASEQAIRLTARREAVEKQARAVTAKSEKAWRAGNKEEAISYVEELVALDPEVFQQPAVWKAEVLIRDLRKPAEGHAYIRAMSEGAMKDYPEALNAFAWLIVDGEEEATRDLDLAEKVARRAETLTKGGDPNVLDTLARVQFLKGDADGAIATLEKALPLAGDDAQVKQQLEESIGTYKKAKAEKK